MRFLLAGLIPLIPLVAGCLAFGGDAGAPGGMIGVNWETALTVYGPMGGVIIWFMTREKKRDERLFVLVEKCTEVMAKVENALAQSHEGDEKQRAATYQLRDDVRELAGALRDLSAHMASVPIQDNTRVIPRNE